jgi:hypothetical protein
VGEGEAEQRGGSEEWDVPDEDDTEEEQDDAEEEQDDAEEEQDDLDEEQDDGEQDVEALPGFQAADEPPASPIADQLWMDVSDDWQEGREARDDNAAVQVPELVGRITIQSRPEPEEDDVFTSSHTRREERPPTAIEAGERIHRRFNELLDARPRERSDVADRIAYLFPRPETTEWNVREVNYDRRRRAEPHNELRAS